MFLEINSIPNVLFLINDSGKDKKGNNKFISSIFHKVPNFDNNEFLIRDNISNAQGAVETFWGCKIGNYEIKIDTTPIIENNNDKQFPYILKNEINVTIYYQKINANKPEIYKFTIPANYKWDGASIPEFLQCIIGKNTTPEFKIASLMHDYLCENKNVIKGNRALSTAIFGGLLVVNCTSILKSAIMIKAVDLYQKLFGNWNNNSNFI